MSTSVGSEYTKCLYKTTEISGWNEQKHSNCGLDPPSHLTSIDSSDSNHQPATSVPLRSSYLLPSTGQLLCFEVTPFEIMGGTNSIVGSNGPEGRVGSNTA